MVTTKKHLKQAAAGLLVATLAIASTGHSQTPTRQMAHPATTQTFSVTAPGRWNQLYTWDYHTSTGTMGTLNAGDARISYTLRSSYDVPTLFDNYTGIFIYDYGAGSWLEVFYAADGTDYIW